MYSVYINKNVDSLDSHYAYTIAHKRTYKYQGLPPVHHEVVGEPPENYWLPDCITTAYMTYHLSDIDPGSFKPMSTSIRVADNSRSHVISCRNVTFTVHDFLTKNSVCYLLTHKILFIMKFVFVRRELYFYYLKK
jgi:hypothetical protein